ncbi:MAG: phosphoribosylaminoimidazolesuccinocarboxamide synthase [Fidelibacterota bacterium]
MMNIKDQLRNALDSISLPGIGKHYRGKVRDNFILENEIIMVTTDRVSAFDKVLGTIPFKGQILTQIAKFWFDKTKDIVPNHILSYPDQQVLVARKAKTLPVEIIVRGYITGSLWREYSKGINGQYGFNIPNGMKKNQCFDKPIVTPTTKAEYGLHDEAISREKIVNGLVEEAIYDKAVEYSLALFQNGQDWARQRGLILVDTKYEFGIANNELILVDEVHTPDSSRFWIADEYEERFSSGTEQKMLDKENIRQWLLDRGFSGDGEPPQLTEDIRISLAEQYIELFKLITGSDFNAQIGPVSERILFNLKKTGYLG